MFSCYFIVFYWLIKILIKLVDQYNKQIFHAFLFNIRNYSPEVINIQRGEVELNIILPGVNNFNIKQKKHGIYVLLYATNTKQDLERYRLTKHSKVWSKHTSCFPKNWTTTYLTTFPSKSFYIIFVDIFFLKLTHEKINRIWIFVTWNL